MNRLASIILSGCLLILGCGGEKTAGTIDTKPFEAAIADYCQAKSFGMKVASMETISVNGDTAKATCKMQDAEGTYAVKVRWEFTFRRPDDAWRVETHTPK